MKKQKILMISDHLLTHSGVAIQSKYLVDGLIKTGKYQIIQLGAAVKHKSYDPIKLNEDLIVIPIDGFGNKKIIRSLLVSEKPDALLIFTDPRFFNYLFEMEDEIHQVCPILYWHVWDNKPYPNFNSHVYDSVDSLNCISYLTYNLLKSNHQHKTAYIPHSFPDNVYYPLDENLTKEYKSQVLGKAKINDFTVLWANRNTRRKRPADLLKAWQIFLFSLKDKHKKSNATLIMHTNPEDSAGQNLYEVAKNLKIQDNVRFSTDVVSDEEINILHNISDCSINISFAEGFGLSTLISLYAEKPIIVTETGGLTRQVVNPITLEKYGIGLKPDVTTISGNQEIHYLNEDYVKVEKVSKAILQMYEMSENDRKSLGKKCREYALSDFNYENMISSWDKSLQDTIKSWKESYKRINVVNIKELV